MATPDAIAHILASTLNPDSGVRIAAELSLSELLKNPRKPISVQSSSVLTSHPRRVGTFARATRAYPGCRVLFATDESYLSCIRMGRLLMALRCVCAFVASTRRLSSSGSTSRNTGLRFSNSLEGMRHHRRLAASQLSVPLWITITERVARQTKDQIRRAVFQGLSDSDRKIRSLCVR